MLSAHRLFASTPLSACIALALPLWSGAAIAQSTFGAQGAFAIGADQSNVLSQPKSGSFDVAATAGAVAGRADGVPASYLDSSASVAAASLGDGHFGGSVVARESYGSQSPMSTTLHMVYRDALVNTTAADQLASFALHIDTLAFTFDYGTQRGTNLVSFAARVFVDGSSQPLWSSTFRDDDGLGQAVATGTDIGLTAALASNCNDPVSYGCLFRSGGFGIADYTTTIALGTVGANQSIGIRYEVDLATETDMYGGGAGVSFNDPSQLSSNGAAAGSLAFAGAGGSVAAVPEPETYAMMAAGLATLAVARRRRRR